MKNLVSLLLFAPALLFSSCSIIGVKDISNSSVPSATMLIVNASPDSKSLGMYVNGAIIFGALPYTDSLGYFQLGQSSYSMTFYKTDTANFYLQDTIIVQTDTIIFQNDTITIYKNDTTFIPTDTIAYQQYNVTTAAIANIDVLSANAYSIFLIDSVNKLKTVYITDNLTAPDAGQVKLRFFHFASGLPPLDLALAGGGQVLFSNRSFNDTSGTVSYADFTSFKPGTYNLELRLAGTSTVVASLPSVTFSAGKIYTLYANGFAGGTGLQSPGIGVVVNKN